MTTKEDEKKEKKEKKSKEKKTKEIKSPKPLKKTKSKDTSETIETSISGNDENEITSPKPLKRTKSKDPSIAKSGSDEKDTKSPKPLKRTKSKDPSETIATSEAGNDEKEMKSPKPPKRTKSKDPSETIANSKSGHDEKSSKQKKSKKDASPKDDKNDEAPKDSSKDASKETEKQHTKCKEPATAGEEESQAVKGDKSSKKKGKKESIAETDGGADVPKDSSKNPADDKKLKKKTKSKRHIDDDEKESIAVTDDDADMPKHSSKNPADDKKLKKKTKSKRHIEVEDEKESIAVADDDADLPKHSSKSSKGDKKLKKKTKSKRNIEVEEEDPIPTESTKSSKGEKSHKKKTKSKGNDTDDDALPAESTKSAKGDKKLKKKSHSKRDIEAEDDPEPDENQKNSKDEKKLKKTKSKKHNEVQDDATPAENAQNHKSPDEKEQMQPKDEEGGTVLADLDVDEKRTPMSSETTEILELGKSSQKEDSNSPELPNGDNLDGTEVGKPAEVAEETSTGAEQTDAQGEGDNETDLVAKSGSSDHNTTDAENQNATDDGAKKRNENQEETKMPQTSVEEKIVEDDTAQAQTEGSMDSDAKLDTTQTTSSTEECDQASKPIIPSQEESASGENSVGASGDVPPTPTNSLENDGQSSSHVEPTPKESQDEGQEPAHQDLEETTNAEAAPMDNATDKEAVEGATETDMEATEAGTEAENKGPESTSATSHEATAIESQSISNEATVLIQQEVDGATDQTQESAEEKSDGDLATTEKDEATEAVTSPEAAPLAADPSPEKKDISNEEADVDAAQAKVEVSDYPPAQTTDDIGRDTPDENAGLKSTLADGKDGKPATDELSKATSCETIEGGSDNDGVSDNNPDATALALAGAEGTQDATEPEQDGKVASSSAAQDTEGDAKEEREADSPKEGTSSTTETTEPKEPPENTDVVSATIGKNKDVPDNATSEAEPVGEAINPETKDLSVEEAGEMESSAPIKIEAVDPPADERNAEKDETASGSNSEAVLEVNVEEKKEGVKDMVEGGKDISDTDMAKQTEPAPHSGTEPSKETGVAEEKAAEEETMHKSPVEVSHKASKSDSAIPGEATIVPQPTKDENVGIESSPELESATMISQENLAGTPEKSAVDGSAKPDSSSVTKPDESSNEPEPMEDISGGVAEETKSSVSIEMYDKAEGVTAADSPANEAVDEVAIEKSEGGSEENVEGEAAHVNTTDDEGISDDSTTDALLPSPVMTEQVVEPINDQKKDLSIENEKVESAPIISDEAEGTGDKDEVDQMQRSCSKAEPGSEDTTKAPPTENTDTQTGIVAAENFIGGSDFPAAEEADASLSAAPEKVIDEKVEENLKVPVSSVKVEEDKSFPKNIPASASDAAEKDPTDLLQVSSRDEMHENILNECLSCIKAMSTLTKDDDGTAAQMGELKNKLTGLLQAVGSELAESDGRIIEMEEEIEKQLDDWDLLANKLKEADTEIRNLLAENQKMQELKAKAENFEKVQAELDGAKSKLSEKDQVIEQLRMELEALKKEGSTHDSDEEMSKLNESLQNFALEISSAKLELEEAHRRITQL